MLDVVLQALDLFLDMPSRWRDMNAGAVVFGAFVFSLFGIVFTAAGLSAFWEEKSAWGFALKLAMLGIGLAMLLRVAAGVVNVLRADRGPT
jgi:hypothetical protein